MFKFLVDWIQSKFFYAILKVEIFLALKQSNAYIEMLTKLAIASKDMTADELKKEFLKELAGVIHNSVHKGDTE